jgi:hypothetical protein
VRFVPLLPIAAAAVLTVLVACSSSDDTTTTPPAATPTYTKDVYPILQVSCANTGCHGANTQASNPDAGPPLGVHISPNDKDDAYKSLINVPSIRFTGTKLILPGDPENSLVMRKMDGTQAELASCPGACGTSMPPPEDPSDTSGSQLLSQKKRDKIRAWIKAGAEND